MLAPESPICPRDAPTIRSCRGGSGWVFVDPEPADDLVQHRLDNMHAAHLAVAAPGADVYLVSCAVELRDDRVLIGGHGVGVIRGTLTL